MRSLIKKISQCEVCLHHLPAGVNPVVQLNADSKILIIGQAPGKKVHESGIPWNDKSGETLRAWLHVSKEEFYDTKLFSIMPMGFCYPGKGKSGDLPPRPECAPLWHELILKKFKKPPLILLIGQYAQNYYLGKKGRENLTETVKHYKDFLPDYFPLPHPSPRNGNWVKVNSWFEKDVIPELRKRVKKALR
jgi:uracil-DNA glycosylase family 4